MKKSLISRLLPLSMLMLAFAAWSVEPQIPAGYYNSLNGKAGAELKAAVRAIIYPHTQVSSYSDLPRYFQKTDVYPNSTRWWDMYSDIPLYAPNFWGLNREHSFPKSWWGGGTDTPAYVDLNHLYPSEAKANMAKSNYPLGVVLNPSFDNGVTKVGSPVNGQGAGAAQVFEPADEYKGDFARTYFYMVTCYSNLTWNNRYMWMLEQNDYPTLTSWAQKLLLEWSRFDMVSDKEINRNEQVYLVQNNRNPFIDFPNLCEYIWGNKKGEVFYVSNSGTPTGEPNLITPNKETSLDFGEVAVGNTTTSQLFFNGENCTGSFSLLIYGDDKDYFSIDTKTISASVVNSSAGYWLTVKYTPAATGEHTAYLLVYDGGIAGSITIPLMGRCFDVPELTALTALPASDITETSYTANWEAPADEVVDYYIVTRTRYVGATSTTEECEAESNMLIFEDFADSDSETYSVQSVRLGYRSPMSNVITVNHAGIDGVTMEQPMAVDCQPGVIRITCAGENTNLRVIDLSGRVVKTVPVIGPRGELILAPGIYFIATDQHPTPIKVVAY